MAGRHPVRCTAPPHGSSEATAGPAIFQSSRRQRGELTSRAETQSVAGLGHRTFQMSRASQVTSPASTGLQCMPPGRYRTRKRPEPLLSLGFPAFIGRRWTGGVYRTIARKRCAVTLPKIEVSKMPPNMPPARRGDRRLGASPSHLATVCHRHALAHARDAGGNPVPPCSQALPSYFALLYSGSSPAADRIRQSITALKSPPG